MDAREQSGIERAIAAAGSPSALARALGVSNQVVGNWRRRGRVPLGRVWAVERATGVPRADLIGPEPEAA